MKPDLNDFQCLIVVFLTHIPAGKCEVSVRILRILLNSRIEALDCLVGRIF